MAGDRLMSRLIRKWLKTGVMEEGELPGFIPRGRWMHALLAVVAASTAQKHRRHAVLRDARIVLLVKTSITKNEMTRPRTSALPRCQIGSKSELW
jgi:hypothetical protein